MEHVSPSLLGLPREIRDQITFYLINHNARKNAPPSPSFSGRREKADHDLLLPVDHAVARYPTLCLVNRQLNDEVLQNLASLERMGQAGAELDIMARGYIFYPTFTYLPGCISRDRPLDLRVHLRIFSTEGFRRNDSWPRQPGTGFRSLLAIVNNFLISGPSLTTPPPETYVPPVHDNLIVRRTSQPIQAIDTGPEPYKINTLSLFITFHDLYTPATWPSTTHEIFRMVKCFATSGVPYPYVKQVKASVRFDSPMASEGESRVYDQATWELLRKVYELQDVYEVPARMSVVALDKWKMDGFRFLLRRETW